MKDRFYNEYYGFEEEEGHDESMHSNQMDHIPNSEIESEGEEGGNKEDQEEKHVAQETNVTLEMKFCSEVVDEPDVEVETEDEVEWAGEGSPRTFKSTEIDIHPPPLVCIYILVPRYTHKGIPVSSEKRISQYPPIRSKYRLSRTSGIRTFQNSSITIVLNVACHIKIYSKYFWCDVRACG